MDDFHVRSQFHEIISNPRLSTFRQLSSKTTTFHATQQASDIHEESATYRTLPTPGLPDMSHFANTRTQNGRQRVTVRYHQDTPLLDLRFSTLDMPSPATIVEEIKSRPQSEWVLPQPSYHQPLDTIFRNSSDSASSFFAPFELVSAPRRTLSQRSARAQLYQAALQDTSANSDSTSTVEQLDLSRVQSMKSIPDSLQAVQDLASQFPGPPPMSATKDKNPMPSVAEALPIPQAFGFPSSEVPLKGSSSREGFALSDNSELSSSQSVPVALSDNKTVRSTRQPTLYNVTTTPLRSSSLRHEKNIDPFNGDGEGDSSFRKDSVKRMSRPVNRLQDAEAGTGDLATAPNTGKPRKPRSQKPISKDIQLSKVRSIGEDPRRSTSLPRHTSPRRGSMQLKDIIVPPRRLNMPEILNESTSTGGRNSR